MNPVTAGNVRRELVRQGSVVERTRGAFRTNDTPASARELRDTAEEAIAADAGERSEPR